MAEAYTDVLGSVGALLPEGQPASSAAQFRYDAFGGFRTTAHPGGDCSGQPNASPATPRMTYTGHLYDPETGLFYFGARYYDPDTGRFLTHDPVAGDALNPPSLHRYLYAYSSPMDYTDPWGEYIPKVDNDPNSGVWHPDFSKESDRARVMDYFKRSFGKGGVYHYYYGMVGNLQAVHDLIGRSKTGKWDAASLDRLKNLYYNYFGPRLQREPSEQLRVLLYHEPRAPTMRPSAISRTTCLHATRSIKSTPGCSSDGTASFSRI